VIEDSVYDDRREERGAGLVLRKKMLRVLENGFLLRKICLVSDVSAWGAAEEIRKSEKMKKANNSNAFASRAHV